MSEAIDLTSLNFSDIKAELSLELNPHNPYYCIDGRIAVFRGEDISRSELHPAFSYTRHNENEAYGNGVYAGNSPTAVHGFAYGYGHTGVSLYLLPKITKEAIKQKRTRLGVAASDSAVTIFPAPLITRFTRPLMYKGKRQDREVPSRWILISSDNPEIYKNAEKIAYLGHACIGEPR